MMRGDGVLAVAAVLAVTGLPVDRFLTSSDPIERLAYVAIANRALEWIDKLQRNQAVHISNAIVKSQRGR